MTRRGSIPILIWTSELVLRTIRYLLGRMLREFPDARDPPSHPMIELWVRALRSSISRKSL